MQINSQFIFMIHMDSKLHFIRSVLNNNVWSLFLTPLTFFL